MPHDLKEEIRGSKVITIVIPHETYPDCSMEISMQAWRLFKRICYVNTSKPAMSIMKALHDRGVETDNFFFIDTATRAALPGVKDNEKCKYLSSESDLEELRSVVSNEVAKGLYNAVIFDSVSALVAHNDEDDVIRFIKPLITRIRHSDCVAILKCAEGDTDSELMKNLSLLSDKIIRLNTRTVMGATETTVTCDIYRPSGKL